MDEQFDNDLNNRIREVFDNFEDPSADEGWLLLREKYPEEAKRRAFAWMWWGAAAALLLLFLGIGLWINNNQVKPEKYSNNKIKPIQGQTPGVTKKIQSTANKSDTVNTENLAKVSADKITHDSHVNGQPNPVKMTAVNKKPAEFAIIPKVHLNDKATKTGLMANNKVDSTKINNNNKVLALKPALPVEANKTANAAPIAAVAKPDDKSINDMFNNDHKVKNPTKEEKVITETDKVRFGVFAATYFNYAQGSNNQVNLGLGFTTEISISKNLKFMTGITVAQNSLSFDSGIPTAIGQTSFNAPASYANAAAAGGANYAASTPAFKNYSANLVGLDIPLNLKYEFNPQKNNFYVLAGVSSGTFINETYTYQYNYPALLSPSLQQGQNETLHKNFDSFYFAKMFNLAFGVAYPLGKNRLIFEPFLKYPLQGLGSQNIRFGAGGVNLKFDLQVGKK